MIAGQEASHGYSKKGDFKNTFNSSMRVQCEILSKINPVLFLCSKFHGLFRQHPGGAAHCLHFAQATDTFQALFKLLPLLQ